MACWKGWGIWHLLEGCPPCCCRFTAHHRLLGAWLVSFLIFTLFSVSPDVLLTAFPLFIQPASSFSSLFPLCFFLPFSPMLFPFYFLTPYFSHLFFLYILIFTEDRVGDFSNNPSFSVFSTRRILL